MRPNRPEHAHFVACEFSARRGFTLLEVMLVAALIVLLAGIAYVSLDSMILDYQLTQATDQVRARLALARVQAMNEGRPYRVAIQVNGRKFRLAPDTADFWNGSGPPPAEPGTSLIIEETLEKGIGMGIGDPQAGAAADPRSSELRATGAAGDGSWTTIASFLPDGTCREDVVVVFNLKKAQPVFLKLRALTGSVSVTTAP